MNVVNPLVVTAESVTIGHPDKIADRISDGILAEALRQDASSRVAVETTVHSGIVNIFGEMTTSADIDFPRIVHQVFYTAGYLKDEVEGLVINVNIIPQSGDIAAGVDSSEDFGAGDQGIMYGYATTATESGIPLELEIAHRLTAKLTEVANAARVGLSSSKILAQVRPDGKAQVTLRDGKLETVVVSIQHTEDVREVNGLQEFRAVIEDDIVEHVLSQYPDLERTDDYCVLVNPAGYFVQGGPWADSGLTGRKLMVDTYGGRFPHGGGAFSGKDATKVDRSGAYMARHIAVSLLSAYGDILGFDEVRVALAYAIGVSEPVMVAVDTGDAERDARLSDVVTANFNLTPRGIIEHLDLRNPMAYGHLSLSWRVGHFGVVDFPWELPHPLDK